MNVYWAIPYKTVTFSEEKRQKPNGFLGFPQTGEQWIV